MHLRKDKKQGIRVVKKTGFENRFFQKLVFKKKKKTEKSQGSSSEEKKKETEKVAQKKIFCASRAGITQLPQK